VADHKVRIDKVTEQIRPTPAGDLVTVRVVTYFVGEQGPFQERFPADGFNADTVLQQLEAKATEVRKLLP
jgi:hypothetical protein